ncbi:MAG TPA: carboxylating nicotinate-nucleotide diphosphorylase [Pyrinomonadaceae bacterium]|nr:carboxylating nicotinate-nucleotide diphosphorylase [Pyrinomonadaceae bacterium]
MNWFDEGALYSQIATFLREDLGRGDITTQTVVARNTRARARFVAGETMVVAGLEAAEEVFLSLDSQQQLEAFVADGEEVEGGKVIARTIGFADVLLSAEQVALNLIQRLSGIATLTNRYVKALEGTNCQVVDSRATAPGLRLLEKYAVKLGGGVNGRFGLDDGVLITANHLAIGGGIARSLNITKEKLGHLHKIAVQVGNEADAREATTSGADILVTTNPDPVVLATLVAVARELAPGIRVEYSGNVTPEGARLVAEAGISLISIEALTNGAPASKISFQMQAF